MRSVPRVVSTVLRTVLWQGRNLNVEVSCRYNQAEGGLVCYDSENQLCSSNCHFCNQLSASVVFDTEKLTMVEKDWRVCAERCQCSSCVDRVLFV